MSRDYHRPKTNPKARQVHRCIGCLTDIPVGEVYVRQTGFYDGRAYVNKFHSECWDDLASELEDFGEFTPGCCDQPERLAEAVKYTP